MINLVLAFLDEARPLIEHYGLKQKHFDPFPVYEKDNMRLILSKMGCLASACAVTTLHHLYQTSPGEVWLNIGLAGHLSLDLETGVLVSKVMHQDHKECFYPSFVLNTSIKKCPLRSLNIPSLKYEPNTLYDMEGFGFYQAASRYATLERIHLYKVISDNQINPLSLETLKQSKNFITHHIKPIDEFILALKSLVKAPLSSPHLSELLDQWRFSQTERFWIEKHLPILNHHFPAWTPQKLKAYSSSKDVLKHLKEELKGVEL